MEKILNKVTEFISNVWENVLIAVIILVAGYFLTKLLMKIIKRWLDKSNMDFSLEKFILNTVRVICYIVLIISALSQLNISTTGLIACFSAGAAAIALALKDSLSNIACGIILLFSRPFVTGDVIEIEGDVCTVLQIDLIHTKVQTFDNKCIVIPNSVVSNEKVVNCSAMEKRRVDIKVPVSYNADIENVKKIITQVALNNKKVLPLPEKPFIRMNSFNESSVEILVKVWTNTQDYWDVYYDMQEDIKKALEENNITIPFNQLDVHITDK